MSERDDRLTADEKSEGAPQAALEQELEEGAGPGAVGALDGAAAVGSLGATSTGRGGGVMPSEPPDPRDGAD
jgi:hypothetical protein